MSKDWYNDILQQDSHYGFDKIYKNFNKEQLQEFLKFRILFLDEELNELKDNQDNPEEIVDALIDLCVVAVGTLTALGVNAHIAWDEVARANLSKIPGVKESRPNPLGLPDLIKPEGWKAPSHINNHGRL